MPPEVARIFALLPRPGKPGWRCGRLPLVGPNGGGGADRAIFLCIWTLSSGRLLDRMTIERLTAGAGGGCGRSSAISRKISWNICRGMATSAVWKAT